MKKFKQVSSLLKKNKQLRRAVAFVGLIVLIVGGVLASIHLRQEQDSVSAHPTATITLDENNAAKKFVVPIDGAENLEYTSGYSDFRQLNMNIPSLGKQLSETEIAKTKLFSSQIWNYTTKSFVTAKGNVISMQIYTTYPYGAGYNNINQTRIILQSRTGEVLDTKWVYATPNDVTQPSGNKGVVYNTFFQKTGTEFMALYTTNANNINTTTYVDEGTHLSISPLDDGRAVDTSSVQFQGQVIQGCWISHSGTNMSLPVIYPSSTKKDAYINIEHFNGSFHNVVEFEASPEVLQHLNGLNSQNYATIANMYPISDSVVYGTEYTATVSGGVVTRICRWDIDPVTKKGARTEIARIPNSSVGFIPNISDNNRIIAQIYRDSATSESQVELIELDLGTSNIETLKVFPAGTRFSISNQGAGYFYAGQVSRIEGELEGIGRQPGIYSGYMDADFNWKSSSSIQLEFPEQTSVISMNSFVGNEDLFVISGAFTTRETNFIDEVVYGNYPGEPTTGSDKQWLAQDRSPQKGNAFVSILRKTDDWSPLIKAPKSFTVNLDDSDLARQEVRDKWLLTGSKTGTITDPGAVQVYDTMDIDNGLFLYGIDWLRARINRNPNGLVYDATGTTLTSADPIDWEKLGFDRSKAGPQNISYFVTDSQKQTSTASTYINKITNETVIDDDDQFALEAKNFHVPLSSVGTALANEADFKKMARTVAWSLTNHGSTSGDYGQGLDEDGKDAAKLSAKVTVNAEQLKALREATVAKPYPVDVVYKPRTGLEITNRVWVFVTTKNTIPNSETNPAITPEDTNGVVYYGDDYSLPYRLRKTQNKNEVLTRGNVKVYDYYDYTHETAAELPPLADANTNPNKLDVNLAIIHNAAAPGKVTPSVTYKWDGAVDENHKDGSISGNETVGYLDVNLTGDALFHVRQVVLDDSAEIVVPSKSYVDVQNVLTSTGTPGIDPDYRANFTANSGKLTENPAFTEVVVATDHLSTITDQVQLSLVTPEFYQYLGYYLTTQDADNNGASHVSNTVYTGGPLQVSKADMNTEGEFWITLYIKPNTDDQDNTKIPQPYSWDYEKNDLGKIKTQ